MRSGYLYPDIPAVVEFSDDGALTITDPATASTLRAEGAFANELTAALEGHGLGPVLRALGAEHPFVQTVLPLTRAARLPLDRRSALAQDGFGTLFVELTGQCNEQCVHCYAGAGPQVTTALDRATCEAVVDDAAALGFRRVQFTGGDPLLCDFLPELLARASRVGIPDVEVYTNGLLLSEALLDRVAPLGPGFAFSFYSHDAATHDAITRTPDSHRRTRRAIRRALDRGLRVRASMVVMAENAGHESATVAYLRALGVAAVSVTANRPVGRGTSFEGADEAAGTEGEAHAGVQSTEGPARRGKLCVTSDGSVTPCVFNRADVLGRVPARRLRDIVAAPAGPTRSSLPLAGEIDAARAQLQCASCRVTAYALRACGSAA